MKYIKSHNTMDMETGEFSMNIDGKTVNVINAQIVHCKNCNSIAVSDEVKDKAKEFVKVYLYPKGMRTSENLLKYGNLYCIIWQ